MSVLRLNRAVAVEEDDIPYGSYRYRHIDIESQFDRLNENFE